MKNYLTEQENFWAGDFGNNYISRNKSENLLASNLNFFSTDLKDPNSFFTLISTLLDSLLSLSKLEHNRILLLIRKFQQESHFHKLLNLR